VVTALLVSLLKKNVVAQEVGDGNQ